jgi:hypothetical protein
MSPVRFFLPAAFSSSGFERRRKIDYPSLRGRSGSVGSLPWEKIFCGRLAAFWRTTPWYLWVSIPESPSIRTIRAIADADLDAFVEALATRISKFDKWAIANTKRLVNTSLPPDVELGAGWDACIASLGRSAAQDGIKALMARGFHKPGDVENRLGYYLSQIPR